MRSFGYGLAAAGAVLLVTAGYLGIVGEWQERRDRERFVEALEVSPALTSSQQMDALGVLRLDRLGWSVIVRPTASDADLSRGAGWIPGTAQLGSRGNTGIAGHRDTFFRPLRHFKVNDEITLATGKETVRYVVKEMLVVEPSQVSVIAADARASLTLVTCYPFYLVGHAPQRFIVKAYQKHI